jgi:hypothetical protein
MLKHCSAPVLLACLTFAFAHPGNGQVEFKAAGTDHISISIDGQPFSDFFVGSAYPKPFLAPLRTASGLLVTRQFPMQEVAGESRDHPHHRGLFIGYGNVSGVNFWENEFDYKTGNRGKIILRKIDALRPGKASGTLAATFEWRSPQNALMLEEHRSMTFSGGHDLRIVDIDATFTAKTNVKFEDTKEGFFAIRVADSMAEKNGGIMRNSEGAQTEKNVWGKRAEWVDYDGSVDNAKVGIVVFDNPGNYNHPPRWHSRAYGLFAVNPFGLKDFDRASSEAGGKSLATGESLRFRYRVIIHPGDVPMKKVADWYADYTKKSK